MIFMLPLSAVNLMSFKAVNMMPLGAAKLLPLKALKGVLSFQCGRRYRPQAVALAVNAALGMAEWLYEGCLRSGKWPIHILMNLDFFARVSEFG